MRPGKRAATVLVLFGMMASVLALGGNRDWIWPFLLLPFSLALLFRSPWWPEPDRRAAIGRAFLIPVSLIGFMMVVGVVQALTAPLWTPNQHAWWQVADRDLALRTSFRQLLPWIGGLALVAVAASHRGLRRVLQAMLLFAVVIALLASALAMVGARLNWLGQDLAATAARFPFVNRNHLAGFLELAAALGFGLLCADLAATPPGAGVGWRARTVVVLQWIFSRKLLVRFGLVLIVIGMVMTRSRMGNAVLMMVFLGGGILAWLRWQPRPRGLGVLLISLFVVDVVVIGSWFGIDEVASRLADTELVARSPATADAAFPAAERRSDDPGEDERLRVARAALRLWQQSPVFGLGAGSFRLSFPSVKPDSVVLSYEHAHNDHVQLLVERGLLGLACVWTATMWFLGLAWRALVVRQDPLLKGVALASMCATTASFVHGFVDFNAQIPANALWSTSLMLLAAVALRAPGASTRNGSNPERGSDT